MSATERIQARLDRQAVLHHSYARGAQIQVAFAKALMRAWTGFNTWTPVCNVVSKFVRAEHGLDV